MLIKPFHERTPTNQCIRPSYSEAGETRCGARPLLDTTHGWLCAPHHREADRSRLRVRRANDPWQIDAHKVAQHDAKLIHEGSGIRLGRFRNLAASEEEVGDVD